MHLVIIFLFIASNEVGASLVDANNDLLNDVGALEVQGYEVHEKLSDRKHEGRPQFVATAVHRHSSSSQEGEGSSTLGGTGQQKTSVNDNVDVIEKSGGGGSSETNISGKEVIKIVYQKTNSHATPHGSALSDSVKHSVDDDATYTHKPIIVRMLTLSEVDKSSNNKRSSTEDHSTGQQLSPGVMKVREESSLAKKPVASKAQPNFASGRSVYTEIIRQPYYSSYGSQGEKGFVEQSNEEDSSNVGIYEKSSVGVTSETNLSGEEIIKTVKHRMNSQATPYDSSLSDSITHFVSDDAKLYIHKPANIERAMTLLEVDNSSHYNKKPIEEHYNGGRLNPGVLKVNEESVSENPSLVSKAINNYESNVSQYREIIRQPHFSLHGFQEEKGFTENKNSNSFRVDEEESVLHETVPPKVVVDNSRLTNVQDETSKAFVQRGIQGGYSINDENQENFTPKSLTTSTLPSGTQNYPHQSVSVDRINLFSSQPRYILEQNMFGRYPPPSSGEFFFNHNRFSPPFPSSQLDLENYNSRPSYSYHHQPTLHHLEHTLHSSSSNGGNIPVQERGAAVFGSGISNLNLFFPSYPDNGDLTYGRVPFTRPPTSILSYPREELDLGLSEGFIPGPIS